MSSIYERLTTIKGWPQVVILFLGFFLCIEGFAWRADQLGPNVEILDTRFGYTPTDVQSLMEQLGPAGRTLYAWSELTLDLLFPLIYGFLFALLLSRVYVATWGRILVWTPIAAASADVLENSLVAILVFTFAEMPSPLAWPAAVFTLIKMGLLTATLVLLVIGSVASWRR